jgi:hypothetical protein
VAECRPGRLDGLAHARDLVAAEVVEDHHVAGPERGGEEPPDVGE